MTLGTRAGRRLGVGESRSRYEGRVAEKGGYRTLSPSGLGSTCGCWSATIRRNNHAAECHLLGRKGPGSWSRCSSEPTRYFPGRGMQNREANGEGTHSSSRGGDGNLIRPLQRTGLAAVPPRRDRNGARPLCDRDRSRLRYMPYYSRRGRTATA
jgi:hypothetical protein